MSALCCPKVSPSIYKPRMREKTVFYQVIKKYYKTWVKKSEKDDKTIPFHVHREFQGFIKCGILAHGFACAHCQTCNHEFLVGFSCKLRLGVCLLDCNVSFRDYFGRFSSSNDKGHIEVNITLVI